MGWGEPQGAGTTSEVAAAHGLLDGAAIPPGTLAERIFTAMESHFLVDGARLTWKQAYEREHERARRIDRWGALVADLDRCEHGRHEGDVCSGATGCNGPSLGNPVNRIGRGGGGRLFDRFDGVPPDRLVGFGLSGILIVDPGRERRHDPNAWYRDKIAGVAVNDGAVVEGGVSSVEAEKAATPGDDR